jgi:uncharacterized protein (DUF362 family)
MDKTESADERSHDPAEGKTYRRSEFLKLAGAAVVGAALVGAGCGGAAQSGSSPGATVSPSTTSPSQAPSLTPSAGSSPAASSAAARAHLAVATGNDPAAITRAAIEALGGMRVFMRRGADVIVKPNVCTASAQEYAATTNPDVVATIVALCLEAGARRVRVMDNPFDSPAPAAYEASGITAAVEKAGGQMQVMSPFKFVDTAIPRGKAIKRCAIYEDILKADLVVNVPIAKQHSLTRLTLGGKNLMGCIADRQNLHFDLGQCVADLTSRIRPGLTVVDAVRILVAGGPTGGDLADVERKDTVIASADSVAADSYAATLFGLTGADVTYLPASAAMGLGTLDLKKIRIARLSV